MSAATVSTPDTTHNVTPAVRLRDSIRASRKDTTMARYYVSFSFQGPASLGLGIASLDVTTTAALITTVEDLNPVYSQLAQQGYHNNVKILAFSLYAKPTTPPAPQPRTNPAPTAPRHPRRRTQPFPGRSS
jgi:hypothetical protein